MARSIKFLTARKGSKVPGAGQGTVIAGVHVKELVTHPDERGFFREILRVTDPFFDHPFGQWSHSYMRAGVLKAWHYHKKQTDYFYVAAGRARVGLCDFREDSPSHGAVMSIVMGEDRPLVVKVPPGVVHGVKAIAGDVHLIYLMSHTYDPQDEHRLPPDDPRIPFDWSE